MNLIRAYKGRITGLRHCGLVNITRIQVLALLPTGLEILGKSLHLQFLFFCKMEFILRTKGGKKKKSVINSKALGRALENLEYSLLLAGS